ncbi:MAG: D-aminoacyl-tRNA deacylase, partial [Clostridiaceae bacterium]
MRAVVQRVKSSSVEIEGKIVGEVAQGFNILLGVGLEDDINDALYLADKIVNLRVFEDSDEKM